MNLSRPFLSPHFGQEQEQIKILKYSDANYPTLLRQLTDFPRLLYYRGQMDLPDEFCVAVVGTRRASAYGQRITPELVQPLCRNGITIVSGLAYGIDAFAHQAALDYGGRTIAVLPGGLDTQNISPHNHIRLAENILAHGGALVSEYPPGTEARKHHFLARNRIIAGLALGTIIVECDVKSGALITARHALDQNRSVYAVPGPIYSVQSRGPHKLITDGALLITGAADVLDDLRVPLEKRWGRQIKAGGSASSPLPSILSSTEKLIFNQLVECPLHRDEIIAITKLPAAEVIAALTFLEMKDIIRQLDAGEYILNKS